MHVIMKRTGRGVWLGTFPLRQAAPVVERDVRDHLSRISFLFARWEIEVMPDRLRVLVEIRTHIPGRGYGTDSAIVGNVEHVVVDIIDRAQPTAPPARRSVYEWLRAPAL
jgi:hypothetical protein